MNFQDASNLRIPEGYVRTIHDKNSRLLWGSVGYNVSFDGNATQTGTPTPDSPQPISVVTGENVVKVVGKNLCPISEIQNVGWATANTDFKNFLNSLPLGTYSISVTFTLTERNDTTDDSICGFVFQNAGGQIGSISGNTWGNAGIGETKTITNTFTINEAKQGNFSSTLFYGCGNNSVGRTGYATVSNIQLELGSQATSYEAYTSQDYTISLGTLELAKIGTYQDRIYKTDDKWYIEKQVEKVVLDGSETWDYVSSDNGYFQFNTPSMNVVPFGGNPATNALCDHFTPRSRWYVATGKVNNTVNLNGSYCAIRYETYPPSAQGLADFKTYLSNNPTTVYYALATPTTTEITDQTLIDQLEAVYDWVRRHGYNAQVTGDLPIVINRSTLS